MEWGSDVQRFGLWSRSERVPTPSPCPFPVMAHPKIRKQKGELSFVLPSLHGLNLADTE